MSEDPVRAAQRQLHILTQTIEWRPAEEAPCDGKTRGLLSNGYWALEVIRREDGRFHVHFNNQEPARSNCLWWMPMPLGPLYLPERKDMK